MRITAILRLLVAGLILAGLAPHQAVAESATADYDVPYGRFYTQASGFPSEASKGYRITDEESIPFWTGFQKLGGVEILGYPISRRFFWDGYICQATQRGVLQWHPQDNRMQLVNLLDYLSVRGLDRLLEAVYSIPTAKADPAVLQSEADWHQVVQAGDYLLKQSPAIKDFYLDAADPLQLYGLPTSHLVDAGPYRIMRFQRTALMEWKEDSQYTTAGQVTTANMGEIAKDLGVLPGAALLAEVPWEPWSRVSGWATWYGAPFHGRVMRNGEIYDMYNPVTTASTTYPLGSWLRVTRLDTGASIIVRVTDTGAFSLPLVTDLSWAAFAKLADPLVGAIRVTVERIPPPG